MALPACSIVSESISAEHWLDEVVHELNTGIASTLETRGREYVMRDVREILVGDDPTPAMLLRDRARSLELEPLASLLSEVLR